MNRTIVTASDESHGLELVELLKTCESNMKEWDVIVYDLGLNADDIGECQKACPRAEFRQYDYSKYPAWHNVKINAGEYGWKPVIIETVAKQRGGILLWTDAGGRLIGDFTKLVEWAQSHGLWARSTRGKIREYTDPKTLLFLDASYRAGEAKMLCAGQIIFQVNAAIDLIEIWAELAHEKECFAPEGSRKHPLVNGDMNPAHNHRQDQSVFSALCAMSGIKPSSVSSEGIWLHRQDFSKRKRNVR